jgi:hypothetical protein
MGNPKRSKSEAKLWSTEFEFGLSISRYHYLSVDLRMPLLGERLNQSDLRKAPPNPEAEQ